MPKIFVSKKFNLLPITYYLLLFTTQAIAFLNRPIKNKVSIAHHIKLLSKNQKQRNAGCPFNFALLTAKAITTNSYFCLREAKPNAPTPNNATKETGSGVVAGELTSVTVI